MATNYDVDEQSVGRIERGLTAKIDRANRRRRRTKLAAFAAAGVVLGSATTGGAVLLFAPQEVRDYSVFCYEGADTNSRSTQVALTPGENVETGEQLELLRVNALDTCSLMWSGGVLGQPGPPEDPNNHQYPVPTLQACVRNDGVAAVFASDDSELCSALGLRELRRN